MAIVEGTSPDANRTPVLDVAYGNQFKVNATDIRTQAIVHPKVIGTQTTDSTGAHVALSSYGQTLDQGVRVKNFGGRQAYIRVEDIGATLDGPGAGSNNTNKRKAWILATGSEMFFECSNLSQVHYRNDGAGTDAFGLTFIAS